MKQETKEKEEAIGAEQKEAPVARKKRKAKVTIITDKYIFLNVAGHGERMENKGLKLKVGDEIEI